MVEAHEANRQARRHFAGESGLEEADDALFFFAGAQQKDIRGFGSYSARLFLVCP